MAGNEVPDRRTVCGAAWLTQQRSLKEQADPFLQGMLLAERSRCWTAIELVISPISLNTKPDGLSETPAYLNLTLETRNSSKYAN